MHFGAVTKLLLSTIVVHDICKILLRAQKVTEEDDVVAPTGIHDIDLAAWQQAYNENQRLLVLLYQLEGCERCPAILETLSQILGKPELPQGLTIAKSFSPELAAKTGTEQFPSLVFLREKSHVVYDGNFEVKDILQWVLVASNKIIQRVNDDSFTDIISAVPGVNVEDWLLVFYKEACKNTLSVVESFGVKIYGQIKVAKISAHDSPRLTHRFRVANCPELVYIKHGKVYKYQLPTFDVASLKDFVENSYRNLEGEPIPDEDQDVDSLGRTVADFVKVHLRGDNQYIIVASVCTVVAGLVLVICCCRPKSNKRPKKSKKE
ncbi:hypothetical protein BsWGS_29037 [Bradybaena similaris]